MKVKAAMGRLPALALLLALAAAGLWPGSIAWAQVQPATAPTADAVAAPASSNAAQRDAALERIRQERNALSVDRKAQEAECYRKFAVEDCLRGVRASTRGAEALLRAREIDIKDAERKEKAAERQRAIAEKLSTGDGAAGQLNAEPASGAVPRKSPVDKAPTLTLRDADAARRAQEQRSKLQERSQAESTGAASTAAREAKARAEYAQKVQAAEERRKRVARSQAEEQAAGKKPAAPLPQSPASR